MASGVILDPLPGGALDTAPIGAHVVLEAASGALLHAVRVSDGLVALRAGMVRHFQISRNPPSAAVVRYPPPFSWPSEVEQRQVVERTRLLLGLDLSGTTAALQQAGGVLDLANEAMVSECAASFCVTGLGRSWNIGAAYEASRATPTPTNIRVEEGPATQRHQVLASSSGRAACEDSGERGGAEAMRHAPSAEAAHMNSVVEVLGESAMTSALHVGFRSSAAKTCGSVAAAGFEGYALYREVGEHGDKLDQKKISADQYQERVSESTITSAARAVGGLAGAGMGQLLVPVPVVGAVVGGVCGAAMGGFQATSFASGMLRLAGNKAKGGDDLVRCVEHLPSDPVIEEAECGAL
uniref:Uncharacterized protein n=1 Tax=Noctiluca scintillans TaxID=2966 RepID=A0A7S1F822_NOCSC|mmetsp:Transcript_39916/g.105922  ORF Transcript_39916/g.105922 Transcript_39916/m.105922 type:complete len:353 (+) Transcript_39916:47-1105(+)